MTRKVRWAKQARADREAVFRYLLKEADLSVASAADDKFATLISLLKEHPETGRAAGRKPNQRKMTLARFPFILIYVIESDWISILRILHTSRRIAGQYSD